MLLSVEDGADSMRAVAPLLDPKKAGEMLQKADAMLSDGPESAPANTDSREEAIAAWERMHGGKYDDPEMKARVAAAYAALNRHDRERADATAQAEVERQARAAEAQNRRRRRGRRE